MLVPLIVAPLIVCTLIMLVGWIYDSAVRRAGDGASYPLFPAPPGHSRGKHGTWGLEPSDCVGLAERSTGWWSS
jgi:hypothetical protein